MQKLIVIVGPTATGKSDIAADLAKRFNGEVVSADSRQVYKGLDIGTGKITKEEMRGVPHHLLDVADPKDRFSVAEYKKLADSVIDDVFERGKLPILCGGTGLYVDTILSDIKLPEVAPNEKLRTALERKTAGKLFRLLEKKDPKRAGSIDPRNKRRLVRAIEIAEVLEKVPAIIPLKSRYDALVIGLDLPDDLLQKKILERLFIRIKKGMVAEAERLHENGLSWKRMDELGLEYRYSVKLLRKEIDQDRFVKVLQQKIWQYAKRQRTWFKRNKAIQWFDPEKTAKISAIVRRFLEPVHDLMPD